MNHGNDDNYNGKHDSSDENSYDNRYNSSNNDTSLTSTTTATTTTQIPQPIPFQTLIHKVLVKIATRLRELGSSNRQKVILVGSGMYNPLHRLHLRMFYLARQFLEGHSCFEVLGGIVR